MTRYEVLVSETARRDLARLPAGDVGRVREAAARLADDPFRSRPLADIKRLRGPARDYRRLRVGDRRVIYTVEGGRVLVARVLHRREAYTWLE